MPVWCLRFGTVPQADRLEAFAPTGDTYTDEIFSLGDRSDKIFDDNKAYREGWNNADKQD